MMNLRCRSMIWVTESAEEAGLAISDFEGCKTSCLQGVPTGSPDGIRQRHPHDSNEQVHRALLRLLYGDEIVQKMWPLDAWVAP